MATQQFTPTADNNRFAFGFLEDELETLLCLSIALKNQLQPNDPDNRDDEFDPTPWRLAEVLSERLTNVAFTNNMRQLLLGNTEANATQTPGT